MCMNIAYDYTRVRIAYSKAAIVCMNIVYDDTRAYCFFYLRVV